MENSAPDLDPSQPTVEVIEPQSQEPKTEETSAMVPPRTTQGAFLHVDQSTWEFMAVETAAGFQFELSQKGKGVNIHGPLLASEIALPQNSDDSSARILALSASIDAWRSTQGKTTPPTAGSTTSSAFRKAHDSDDDDDAYSYRGRRSFNEADPFDICRFHSKHRTHFPSALREIQHGRKSSCWSWYIFPTAPWIVHGRECGSPTNSHYALRDLAPNTHRGDDAARAFLRFPVFEDGINLRANYLAIVQAVTHQVTVKGIRPVDLVGFLDDPKMRSSLRLFERVSRDGFDDEMREACLAALRACNEKPDQ